MVKFTTLFLLLFLNFGYSFAQCSGAPDDDICRGLLGGLIYNNLYGVSENPFNYQAAFYPSPFIDLQGNQDLEAELRILSFLQYDNGLSVFDFSNKPSYCFKLEEDVSRIEATVAIMEAWNIPPDYSGSSPFDDIDNDESIFGYANKAYDEGFIQLDNGDYNPNSDMSVQEATDFLNAVLNSIYHPVNEDLSDMDNYFTPGIYDPFNLSHSRGINQGVLSHYAKNSFVIPDRKMNLNFSHFYSTTMVELPNGFYQLKPLGTGWSHTYNSYILFEENVNNFSDQDFYFIVWPDGTIHTYDADEEEYLSRGVYDELDEFDGGDEIRITKKDQSRYYYKKLDIDRELWYLTEIRDSNGNKIRIGFEDAEESNTKRIRDVEAPSGKKLNFEYENGYDFLSEITDPIGRTIQFDVDGDNDQRLEDFIDAKGFETDYDYIENDEDAPLADQKKRFLLEEITLPRGNKITAEYDNDNAKLESYQIDDDDPTEIEINFDYPDIEEATVTSPIEGGGSFVEDYEFNLNGVVMEYESPTDDLEFEYPTNNSNPNVLLPTNGSMNGVEVDYDYDNDGNVLSIDIEQGAIVEEFEYDNDNNLIGHTDPNGNITEYSYDGNENLIEILDAEGGVATFQYDNFGQLTSQTNQEGITVSYMYENDGALSEMSAPLGITSSYTYDGINRILSRNSNGLISTYEYDPNDNRTSFTNSGGFVTNYDYDENDNLSSIENANSITTTFTYDDKDRVIEEQFGNLVKEYEYSDEGYLERFTKPSGDQVDYEYDDEGRIEETGTITDVDYNNRNLIESITNDTGTITFDYDDINRIEDITTVHGYVVEYEFKDSGHIDEITYPTIDGVEFEVNYSYDDKNRVFQVIVLRNVGNDGQVIAEYDYFDDDRIEKIEVGNNTRTDFSYDGAGRLNYIEHFKIGAPTSFYFVNHTLDNRGNITNSTESFEPFPTGYVDHGSSSENAIYDYNDNNHILNVNSTDYDVDDDGNTIDEQNSFEGQYDIDDRLTEYDDLDNNTDYEYNPYNQRVEVTREGIRTRYIRDVLNDRVLVELDQNNNVKYYYIYHPDGMLLARMKPNGDLQYYHGDLRGSTVLMTDENADITHYYRYEDFGWITESYEPVGEFNPFRYVGLYGVEYDKHDLYYMRARYYKPSIGRFLTEDSVWHTNLYPYADNNPINKIDPMGTNALVIILLELFIPKVAEAPTIDNHSYADENGLSTGIALIGYASPQGAVKNTAKSTILSGTKNIKLRNIIEGLYKKFKGKNVGDGGAIDALKHEIKTGNLVGGKSHREKIQNNINGLLNLKNSGKLNPHDSQIASDLITKMINALLGK